MSEQNAHEEIVDVHLHERLLKDTRPWYDVIPRTSQKYVRSWSTHFTKTNCPYVLTRKKIHENGRARYKYTIWIKFNPIDESAVNCADPEFTINDIAKFAEEHGA